MTIKEILVKYNMTKASLSRRFGIPYRTIDNWTSEGANARKCPDYVIKMIVEILENRKEKALEE